MDNPQDSSLSAPSDFTENMTMYMSEDFDIARWRRERKLNKNKTKIEAGNSSSDPKKKVNPVNDKDEKQSSEKEAAKLVSTPADVNERDAGSRDEEDIEEEDEQLSESSESSHEPSVGHPTSTLDLPGFAWPVSVDATREQEHEELNDKSQQMLTEIQDLRFQIEQTMSENTMLKEENDKLKAQRSKHAEQNSQLKDQRNKLIDQNGKLRAEIDDLRTQFSGLAEQLAEFQIDYDSLQKERHTIAKVLMQEWGMKEAGKIKNNAGCDGVGFKYT